MGSRYNYVFHAFSTQELGFAEVNYVFGLVQDHDQPLCLLQQNQIWKLQVVGNISKSSDQLKFYPSSLYFSLLPYHRSCSSLDFFGIVIVNVCFFPGADFLLNSALGNWRVAVINQRIQFQEIPPVNGVHVRSGTFPLFANRQIHLRQRHCWTSSCSTGAGGTVWLHN